MLYATKNPAGEPTGFKNLAPRVGLEPTTTRLTAAGSTIELSRNMVARSQQETVYANTGGLQDIFLKTVARALRLPVGTVPLKPTKSPAGNPTGLMSLAPRVGLEPTTTRLTAAGSTIELSRNMGSKRSKEQYTQITGPRKGYSKSFCLRMVYRARHAQLVT